MLYAFFWVIPRRLKFICQRFGTLCLFHLHRQAPTCLWRWNRQSVLKRRHINFRRRGITQKKAYNKFIIVPSKSHSGRKFVICSLDYASKAINSTLGNFPTKHLYFSVICFLDNQVKIFFFLSFVLYYNFLICSSYHVCSKVWKFLNQFIQ